MKYSELMEYVNPKLVLSPVKDISAICVIENGGAGKRSTAILKYKDEFVIGTRTNGTRELLKGSPTVRGLPTWNILDKEAGNQLLKTLAEEKKEVIDSLIELTKSSMEKEIAKHFFCSYTGPIEDLNLFLSLLPTMGNRNLGFTILQEDDYVFPSDRISRLRETYYYPISRI